MGLGGGTQPTISGRHYNRVWSDDVTAAALAAAANVPFRGLPADAEAWLGAVNADNAHGAAHLLTIESLSTAVHYQDLDAWRTRITALEKDWMAPLFRALRARRLSEITIVTPAHTQCLRFIVRPLDLIKVWRRSSALTG